MQNNTEIKIYINDTATTEVPELENYNGYLVLLNPKSWDDFGFKTTFNISIINFSKLEKPKQNFSDLKLAVKNQTPSNAPMEDVFFQEYLGRSIEDRTLMCAEKTGGFNLVNYRHSSGVYHEQETEDLHRRI
ncbi:hypothetical protein [Acinetobacter terrestris]|uniref:hypothetical protein n=1 Tax=Acinetobacter terrestris TaxID=2529843 RepID=UPI00103A8222|nr:hypothetical protein [Acinetobacter terrestris]TCB62539.1 hypothetical protein E0H81_12220 [Acinetobacter terrestris]